MRGWKSRSIERCLRFNSTSNKNKTKHYFLFLIPPSYIFRGLRFTHMHMIKRWMTLRPLVYICGLMKLYCYTVEPTHFMSLCVIQSNSSKSRACDWLCLYLIAFFIAQKQDRLTLKRKLRQLFTCMSIIPIDLKVKQKKAVSSISCKCMMSVLFTHDK